MVRFSYEFSDFWLFTGFYRLTFQNTITSKDELGADDDL